MKIKDIRSKSDAELREEMERLRRELYNLRAQAVSNPTEDTTRFRESRRTVARILTVLAERARAAGPAASPLAAPKAPKTAQKQKTEKPAKAEKKPAVQKPEKAVKTEKKPAGKPEKSEKSEKSEKAEKPKTDRKSEKKGQKG